MSAPAKEDTLDDFDPRLIGHGLTPAEMALNDLLPVVSHAAIYDRLFDLGIHGDALSGRDAFSGLHVEEVCPLSGGRFEFARDMRDTRGALLAVIIPCNDEGGVTIDLAAWNMDTGELLTWRGQAALLGEECLGDPWQDADGICVFPSPKEWLRADRKGVVLINAKLARWRLVNMRLIVADCGFGKRLRNALRLPEPQVFVERAMVAA